MDHSCFFRCVFVMLSRASDFCYFPFGILGQVWYLVVSIPDLSHFA